MAIKFSFIIKEKILYIKTEGFDESLDEVIEYGISVRNILAENNIKKALLDETELEYRLDFSSNVCLIKYYEKILINIDKIAVVCNKKFYEEVKFLELMAQNRWLPINIFTEMDAAEIWLKT